MRFKIGGSSGVVGVRAAERFGHDFVYEFEAEQFLRGDFEGGGGFGGIGAVFPQNRRTTFRADDRIIRVLQNQNTIRNADAERARPNRLRR